MKTFLSTINLLTLCFVFFAPHTMVEAKQNNHRELNEVLVLEINSSINPATLDYIEQGLKKIKRPENTLFLIKMNTPGGLLTTTKDIITSFGRQSALIAIWVTPEGASATSAGAIIGSAAHFLFMSPGTNIGAATPVGLGKDIDGPKPQSDSDKKKSSDAQDPSNLPLPKMGSDNRAKAINDLVALTSSLSHARGRNAKAFSKMISQAASYDANKALELNIINDISSSVDDVLQFINGKKMSVQGNEYHFSVAQGVEVKQVEMTLGQSILNIFSNPATAYILFMVGAALIYLEFQAPGGFIAGSLGTVCLLLAGLGFQVLPLNWGGLALIIVAFVLFVMEVYITSYGILSLAGLGSLIFGSLILYRTENSYLQMQSSLIFSVVAGIVCFMAMIVYVIIKDRKSFANAHFFNPNQQRGKIIDVVPNENDGTHVYQVRVAGEIWRAESKEQFNKGDFVIVDNVDNQHMRILISSYQGDKNA